MVPISANEGEQAKPGIRPFSDSETDRAKHFVEFLLEMIETEGDEVRLEASTANLLGFPKKVVKHLRAPSGNAGRIKTCVTCFLGRDKLALAI